MKNNTIGGYENNKLQELNTHNDQNGHDRRDDTVDLWDSASGEENGRLPRVPAWASMPLVEYPRFLQLHRAIDRCRLLTKTTGEPHCMALEGDTGVGKSRLILEYVRKFPKVYSEYSVRMSVFYVLVQSPTTVKGMSQFMLERLGDPGAKWGNQTSQNTRLIGLIKRCGIDVVIFDEFHHLVDPKTRRVLHAVADWLKMLIKQTGVTVVIVGIKGEVEQVLSENQQLSRLFAVRETLEAFAWDMLDPNLRGETNKEFRRFLRHAEQSVGMPLDMALYAPDLLFTFHYATDGVVANVLNLLQLARLYSLERGGDRIEMQDLWIAYSECLEKHVKRPNPFSTHCLPEPSQGGRGGQGAVAVARKAGGVQETRVEQGQGPTQRKKRK